MKAIVQTAPEPRSIAVDERERPTPAANEVLVRVHSAGLCGSDAHAYRFDQGYEWVPTPRIMGHEYAGEVVAVGDRVERVEPGARVVEHPIHHCGTCFQCKNGQANVCRNFEITGMHNDGAYAEYTTVSERFVHEIPDDVSLEHAAITEPTSIAARAVLTRSNVAAGDAVLVEGPGPIGVLTAAIAATVGARVFVSGLARDGAYRLPLAERLGAEPIALDTDDLGTVVDRETRGGGFDVVFDTTGHHTGVEMAAEHVRKGGQVVVVGLPASESDLYMTPLVRGEVDLNASYGSLWPDFERALSLLAGGGIDADAIVDRSYSVDEPESAFEDFLAGKTCKPVFGFRD